MSVFLRIITSEPLISTEEGASVRLMTPTLLPGHSRHQRQRNPRPVVTNTSQRSKVDLNWVRVVPVQRILRDFGKKKRCDSPLMFIVAGGFLVNSVILKPI